MQIERIPGKTAGATVRGIDLVHMSDSEWNELEAAFLEHGFLVIKSNPLSSAQQMTFGQRFGAIEFAGAAMANQSKDGVIADVSSQQMRTNIGNEMWHTDSTYKPVSSKVAMLTARVLPRSGGGQTGLADMRAAYDNLDQETKQTIEHLSAYHSTQFSQANDMGDFPPENPLSIYHGSSYLRRLVKVHPNTGDRSIFVARHAFGVCQTDDPAVRLPREESRELLQRLVADAVVDESAVYVHDWEVGDTMVLSSSRSYLSCLLLIVVGK
jgi:alpha-ketoglutarate-dependent taurine dioxygenase